MKNKITVVLGASPNPVRFSHKAVKSLIRHGYEVIPVGYRKGTIQDKEILTGMPSVDNVDTISLYLGIARQPQYYDYMLSLRPRRIIFNPGTVNPDFMEKLKQNGIEAIDGCLLMMLNSGEY